jgi:hypothetical protein
VSVSEYARARQEWVQFCAQLEKSPNSAIHAAVPLYQLAIDLAKACDAHRAPGRSAILRMAGNIAPALIPYCSRYVDTGQALGEWQIDLDRIAIDSVRIARAIMAEVDRPQPGETPITATTE